MHASRRSLTFVAGVAVLVAPVLAMAQAKVPGEKWKQTVTMEMQGMKIPTRTLEVCVPVGKAEESLARPPDNDNCQVTNTKRSGNTFSADIRCTGKQAMEGHMESTTEGNRTIGKMTMQMQGMAMAMNFDSTKLGTACEAVDYSALADKAKASAAAQLADVCAQTGDRITKDPRQLVTASGLYADKGGQCATHASKKNYCSALQTPAGFLSLSNQERLMGRSGGAKDAHTAPLTTSLQSCNLGSADAMRTKLLATAEKQGDWDFLVAEGNDATHQMLTATARRECAGRSFTNAPAGRYAELCRKYGVALARGDRAAAMSAAGVMSDAPAGGTAAQGRANVETPPEAAASGSAAPEGGDATSEAQKSKTREALDKGKKKLKSLFGGGGD